MHSDATLESALGVLRQHYDSKLAGSRERTEAQMRHTLREQLGLDETSAAQLLRQLCDTGRLQYVVGTGQTVEKDASSTTGPVISMPGTQSGGGGGELITTASPAMILGAVDYEGGDVNRGLEDASLPATTGEYEGDNNSEAENKDGRIAAQAAAGYWRIG
ncbi:MAG: hypothetical protein IVW55_01065 [Chloroflexi bacterium]|nr:hypothetical protein [Chloroflexota bacterium]